MSDTNCTNGTLGIAPCWCAICTFERVASTARLARRRPRMGLLAFDRLAADMASHMERETRREALAFLHPPVAPTPTLGQVHQVQPVERPKRDHADHRRLHVEMEKRAVRRSRAQKLEQALTAEPHRFGEVVRALGIDEMAVVEAATGDRELTGQQWRRVFSVLAGTRRKSR